MDQNANNANCCLKKTGLETNSVAGPLPGGCKTGRSKYPLNWRLWTVGGGRLSSMGAWSHLLPSWAQSKSRTLSFSTGRKRNKVSMSVLERAFSFNCVTASPDRRDGSLRNQQSILISILTWVGLLIKLGRSCAKKDAVRLSCWAAADEADTNKNRKKRCFKVV